MAHNYSPTAGKYVGQRRTSTREAKLSALARHTGSDGLRVLALLGVAAFHIRPDWVPGGFLGVVIFLTLAGYYTSRSFIVRPDFKLSSYYHNKLAKLWPPLLFMLVVVGVFSALVLPVAFSYYQASLPSAALGWHNIAEVWRQRSYFDRTGFFDPLTHLWALALEMQYYVLFPLLYIVLTWCGKSLPRQIRPYGRELAGLILLLLGLISAAYMAGAYVPGEDPTPYYYNSFMRANAFLNGAATCLISSGRHMRLALNPGGNYVQARGQVRALRRPGPAHKKVSRQPALPIYLRTSLVWLSLLFILAAYFMWGANSDFLYRAGFYLYSLVVCAYILLGGVKPVPGLGFMHRRPFQYLASRSYYIYLWQYAIMVLLDVALRFSQLNFWPRLGLQLILVFGLSELSYQLFKAYKKLPTGSRLALVGVLALILITLSLVPISTEATAPKLEEAAVQEAIRANASVQESLAAAATGTDHWQDPEARPGQAITEESSQEQSKGPSRENGQTGKAERELFGPTLPASVSIFLPPTDFLDQSDAWCSPANPYGYSESASQTLAKLNLAVMGDSVTALAIPSLRTYVPRVYIDAAAGRQFPDGLALIEALDQSGARADILVVAMSSNSWVEESVIEDYVKLAADRPLIFVNTIVPFVWETTNNQNLAAAALKYDNVYVADWFSAAKGRPDYFFEDAFHPIPEAAEIYDKILLDQVLQALSAGKYKLSAPVDFPAAPPVIYPIIGETVGWTEED